MITAETAARIWSAYREISASEKLLADMKEASSLGDEDRHAPTLTDAFGRKRLLQLGIPSGENGHRLFNVRPELAVSVILAHVAQQKADLAEANEQARIELTSDFIS